MVQPAMSDQVTAGERTDLFPNVPVPTVDVLDTASRICAGLVIIGVAVLLLVNAFR